jgi:hypothetical protein
MVGDPELVQMVAGADRYRKVARGPANLRFAPYSGTIASQSGHLSSGVGWRLLVEPRQRARRTIGELLKFASDLDLDSSG